MGSTKKKNVIEEASNIVNGERQREYGPPERNFDDIAKVWSVFLGVEISSVQVAEMMILLKVMRLRQTPGHLDSLVDIIGYAYCASLMENSTLDKIVTEAQNVVV